VKPSSVVTDRRSLPVRLFVRNTVVEWSREYC